MEGVGRYSLHIFTLESRLQKEMEMRFFCFHSLKLQNGLQQGLAYLSSTAGL